MKKIVFLAAILCGFQANAQMMSGALMDEGRKSTGNFSYVHESTSDGWATFELSVNRQGKVTSARLVETTLKSTPAKVSLRNYVMTMSFEAGTYYPEHHHVIVKITAVRPK